MGSATPNVMDSMGLTKAEEYGFSIDKTLFKALLNDGMIQARYLLMVGSRSCFRARKLHAVGDIYRHAVED